MRKGFYTIIAALAVFSLVMTACPKDDDGGGNVPPSKKTYTITYDGNGKTEGEVPAKQTVNPGENVILAPGTGLKKNSENFGGWNTKADGTGDSYDGGKTITPTGNLKLYVKWTSGPAAGTFTVTFDTDGGTPVPAKITGVEKDATITEPETPTKKNAKGEDYTFDGWFAPDETVKWDVDTDKVTANITLTAHWTAPAGTVEYDVTLKWNEGGTDEIRKVEENQKLPEPEARTIEGYDFVNWYKEAAFTNVYDFNTPVTQDITIYAKWTVKVETT